jgi:hypothetical protein
MGKMAGTKKTGCFSLGFGFLSALLVYGYFVRKRLLNWGASDEEAAGAFPGDELVPDPNYQSTRAITINAEPEAVWPWVIQIGYQRGGFYSYDWLERQAGLKELHSTDQIVTAWQDVRPGDQVAISPVTPLDVAIVEPGQAFVLHAVMNPFIAEIIDRAAQPEGPFMDWSWAFILEPAGFKSCRLIARVRANIQPQPVGRILSWVAIEPAHFLMENKMLQGIRERVEGKASIS